MKFILIKTDNTYKIIEHLNGITLKELQGYVDGIIEYVSLNGNIGYYINEEGKYLKDINTLATMYWTIGQNTYVDDYISGDVIIVGTDEEGETIGLTEAQIKDFERYFKTVEKEIDKVSDLYRERYL